MRDLEGVPALELDADAGPDPGTADVALALVSVFSSFSVSLVDVEAVVVDDEVVPDWVLSLALSSSAVATWESAASAILDLGIHSSYLEFPHRYAHQSISLSLLFTTENHWLSACIRSSRKCVYFGPLYVLFLNRQ